MRSNTKKTFQQGTTEPQEDIVPTSESLEMPFDSLSTEDLVENAIKHSINNLDKSSPDEITADLEIKTREKRGIKGKGNFYVENFFKDMSDLWSSIKGMASLKKYKPWESVPIGITFTDYQRKIHQKFENRELTQIIRSFLDIYENFWNRTNEIIEVLGKCEIETMDVNFYKKVFENGSLKFSILNVDDLFFPVHTFLVDLMKADIFFYDYDELTPDTELSTLYFLKQSIEAFDQFLCLYFDSFDRKRMVRTLGKEIHNEFHIKHRHQKLVDNLYLELIKSSLKSLKLKSYHLSIKKKLWNFFVPLIKLIRKSRKEMKSGEGAKGE